MSEVLSIKKALIQNVRDGVSTPEQAVKAFEKLTPTQVRTGRVYEQKSNDARIEQYRASKSIRREIRANRIPFISKNFLHGLWLSQGLTLVGAKSGRAKSTTASNVLAGFLRSVPDKHAIVISNEEASDAVYERTACILLELPYTQYFAGNLDSASEKGIQQCVEDFIIPRVEIVEEGSYDMSFLEDVQSVIDTAAVDRVGLLLLDYWQVITQSRNHPQLESFHISKMLGTYLKDYGKRNSVPVVAFVQLSNGSEGSDFGSRIQNDKTLVNHSFLAIELEPDFETLTTKFKIHKDRFSGHTGKEVVATFCGGRYSFIGDDAL